MGRALSTLLFPARLTGHSLGLQRPRTQRATDLSSGKPPSLTVTLPYLLGCCPRDQAGLGSLSTLLSWVTGTCLPSSLLLFLH